MKKEYKTPSMTEENLKTDFILRPKPNSQGGGTGDILGKERDDEAEGNPIWGSDGRLW